MNRLDQLLVQFDDRLRNGENITNGDVLQATKKTHSHFLAQWSANQTLIVRDTVLGMSLHLKRSEVQWLAEYINHWLSEQPKAGNAEDRSSQEAP